jgi:hypothetical protein
MFALKPIIEQTAIDHIDECMALDVPGKVKVTMWCLDVPFLLELGGGLAIICAGVRCWGVRG